MYQITLYTNTKHCVCVHSTEALTGNYPDDFDDDDSSDDDNDDDDDDDDEIKEDIDESSSSSYSVEEDILVSLSFLIILPYVVWTGY